MASSPFIVGLRVRVDCDYCSKRLWATGIAERDLASSDLAERIKAIGEQLRGRAIRLGWSFQQFNRSEEARCKQCTNDAKLGVA